MPRNEVIRTRLHLDSQVCHALGMCSVARKSQDSHAMLVRAGLVLDRRMSYPHHRAAWWWESLCASAKAERVRGLWGLHIRGASCCFHQTKDTRPPVYSSIAAKLTGIPSRPRCIDKLLPRHPRRCSIGVSSSPSSFLVSRPRVRPQCDGNLSLTSSRPPWGRSWSR